MGHPSASPASSTTSTQQPNPPTQEETPPTYSTSTSSSPQDPPPTYTHLTTYLTSLAHGPPNETILVPMVHRKDSTSLHRLNPFSRRGYAAHSTPSYIAARAMKRSTYTAHYARDAGGRYVGTAAAAPDAGLVFVVGRGSSAELVAQCEGVAREVQGRRGAGMGGFGMGGWGDGGGGDGGDAGGM